MPTKREGYHMKKAIKNATKPKTQTIRMDKAIYQYGDYSFQVKMMLVRHRASWGLEAKGAARA